MDYQSLYVKTVVELRRMAKEMRVRIPAGASKAIIINLILEADRNAALPETKDDRKTIDKTEENNKENEIAGEKTPETESKTMPEPELVDKAGEGENECEYPRMRVAANPQVIGRRNPITEERNYTEGRGFSTPPRQKAQMGQDNSRQGDRNGQPRQDYANVQRGDRREDMPQNRYAGRQEASLGQRRVNPRYDNAGYQPRSGRFEAPEGRAYARNDGMSSGGESYYRNNGQQNRNGYANNYSENRNRNWRQDAGESYGGIPQETYRDRFGEENGESRFQRGTAGRCASERRDWDNMSSEQDNCPEGAFSRFEGDRSRRDGYYNEEYRTSNPAVPEMLASGECSEGSGILEIQPDGYGFLRAENYRQGTKDVYVSIAQIRRFNLRMGDHVVGQTRPQREGDRYTAMMYITEVNGKTPEEMIGRPKFEELVPVYPDERIRLEIPGENDLSLRVIDMIAPIGKGQRGLIVSQPKAGKTTLLKKVAHAITAAHPEIHLMVLLIDERPEEVTEMKRSIDGEIIYSTFDETPESHVRVSEMVLERAQRLVELGKDVVILMDSITRLARAYNLVIPPTGRLLSGGMDPGSHTVIATALVDTGSRMDDLVYEEFQGTGNMELHLDRKLSDKRVFPAVDMVRSGTRREELLLTEAELEGTYRVRRMLAGGNEQADMEKIISLIEKTGSNAEFYQRLTAYESVYEKSGFSMNRENTK